MAYATTSLSTSAVPGNSNALSADWRAAKPVSISVVTASSSGTGDFTIQWSAQDLTSSGIPTSSAQGLPGPTWLNVTALGPFGTGTVLSSAITSSAGYQSLHFQSSTIDPAAGLSLTALGPIAGVRLNSTALSSTTLTLSLIQGIGS